MAVGTMLTFIRVISTIIDGVVDIVAADTVTISAGEMAGLITNTDCNENNVNIMHTCLVYS